MRSTGSDRTRRSSALDTDAPYEAFARRSAQVRDDLLALLRTAARPTARAIHMLRRLDEGQHHPAVRRHRPRAHRRRGRPQPGQVGLGDDRNPHSDRLRRGVAGNAARTTTSSLPWHFLDEFLEREADFLARGGRSSCRLPNVRTIDAHSPEVTRRRREPPGWKRLWRHSYMLGLRWLVRESRHGWPARRTGFVRLLVPLDPRRYYELGRIAEARFSGRCLDVSSPKLLPSLLQAEGRGQLGVRRPLRSGDRGLANDRSRSRARRRRMRPRCRSLTRPSTIASASPSSSTSAVGEDSRRALRDLARPKARWLSPSHDRRRAGAEGRLRRRPRVRQKRARVVEGRGVFFKHDYTAA